MATIGVLSFSDGREFVHQGIAGFVAEAESRLAATCRAAGHQVVVGSGPITSSDVAVAEARRLAAELTVGTSLRRCSGPIPPGRQSGSSQRELYSRRRRSLRFRR